MRRSFRNTFLAGAAFVIVAVAIPAPRSTDDRILDAKLAHFAAHRNEYELVFFGSSRIYRAFDPTVFARHLPPEFRVRAFNFGMGSLRPHELDALIDEVLSHRPARLRFVVIELMDWFPTVHPGMESHRRIVRWHSPTRTWEALRTLWRADLNWMQRGQLANRHVRNLLARSVGLGEGPDVFGGTGAPEVSENLALGIAYAEGFVALDQQTAAYYRRRRETFLTEYLEIFRRQVNEIDARNEQPGSLRHSNVAAYRRQQQRLLERGVIPIYVVPNLRWGTPEFKELKRQGVLRHVWTFNHVSRFPQLYDERHYFDRGHLNQRGAEIFSRLLAERFAQFCQSQEFESTNGVAE